MVKEINKTLNINTRIEWIDAVKVITMLLVIIGHSNFLYYSTNYGGIYYKQEGQPVALSYSLLNLFISLIYTFHMPLFMSVSGMLFSITNNSDRRSIDVVKNKAYRLLWPFLIMTLMYNTPILFFTGYFEGTKSILLDIVFGELLLLGNNHLWYVMSLFLIFIFAIIIEPLNIRNKKPVLFWIVITIFSIIGFLIEVNGYNLIGIGTALRYLLFFYIGYISLDYINYKIKEGVSPFLFILSAFLTCLFSIIYIVGLPVKMPPPILSIIVAILMGGVCLCLMICIAPFLRRFKWYSYLKRNTYELYLYSCPINYIIIFFCYDIWGDEIYRDNLISIIVFALRVFLQILFSVFIIEIVNKLKLKEKFYKLVV